MTTSLAKNAVVLEFEEHLARIHKQARGDVERERRALYLLALEREELASVGYGGDSIQDRIRRLSAPDDVRQLIGHALRWAARDERTHAVLMRGVLLARGQRVLALQAFGTNVAGLIAGWASAVLQHTTFRRAPLSNLLAFFIAQSGRVLGKVPETAEGTLRAQRFVEFCRFQADAEETAALSWEHIGQLEAQHGDVVVGALVPSPDRTAALAADDHARTIAVRIAADERKHRRLFQVFLDSFNDDDLLIPGIDGPALHQAMATVDPAFVPTSGDEERGSRIGQGGVVVVRRSDGAARADPTALRDLLRATLVDSGLLAEVFQDAPASPRVAVKTTFMMGYDRRDQSSHVDRDLARELALLLREHGASDVAFIEAPNHYDWYFGGRGVVDVARYLGFDDPAYRVVDANADQTPHAFRRGIGQSSVCATWKHADLRLSFAKLRSHPSWLVHLSLNALESLGRRIDELLFVDRQADLLSGLMMILDAFPPQLAILDATHDVPDGLTGLLGDPSPCHPGRLYASRDPLALDFVAARHMGLQRFPNDSALLFAADWFDDPRPRTGVDGVDTPIPDFLSPHRNDATCVLSAMAYPVYSWGGDRGAFWLPVMDPAAFPLRRPETLVEAVVRRALRTLFGFGNPPRRSP